MMWKGNFNDLYEKRKHTFTPFRNFDVPLWETVPRVIYYFFFGHFNIIRQKWWNKTWTYEATNLDFSYFIQIQYNNKKKNKDVWHHTPLLQLAKDFRAFMSSMWRRKPVKPTKNQICIEISPKFDIISMLIDMKKTEINGEVSTFYKFALINVFKGCSF